MVIDGTDDSLITQVREPLQRKMVVKTASPMSRLRSPSSSPRRQPISSSIKPSDSSIGRGLNRREPVFLADGTRFEKEHFLLPRHYATSLSHVLIPKGLIQDRIERLAADIRLDYGDQPIHVLCVLKGSRGFFAELLKVLDNIHRYSGLGLRGKLEDQMNGFETLNSKTISDEVDDLVKADLGAEEVAQSVLKKDSLTLPSLHYRSTPYFEHYVRLKSYTNTESSGELKVTGGDDLESLRGEHVLIVEDIVDTGNTLEKFCIRF